MVQQHGEPWAEARQVSIQRIVYDVIHLEQQLQLSSALLARGLARAHAHALVVVAVSAGKAVDDQIDALWKGGRVDEAMFLNAYAIATVEHLRWQVGDHLRHTLARNACTVLPHYSPGYDGWDSGRSGATFRLIDDAEVKSHSSGAIVLRRIASKQVDSGRLWSDAANRFQTKIWISTGVAGRLPTSVARSSASYAFPEKALAKWRDKRLKSHRATQ